MQRDMREIDEEWSREKAEESIDGVTIERQTGMERGDRHIDGRLERERERKRIRTPRCMQKVDTHRYIGIDS